MKCKLSTIIVMLAAIGLLMAPALGAQGEKGGCKAHNGAMWMMNNLTEQELNNMTLGEFRALKQKEMQDRLNRLEESPNLSQSRSEVWVR